MCAAAPSVAAAEDPQEGQEHYKPLMTAFPDLTCGGHRRMLEAEGLREAGMSQGIVLLLVLAVIVAYVVARTRRRMGLLVTGKTWIFVMTGFVIVVLALWAGSTHH
jgi:hypothetical protein